MKRLLAPVVGLSGRNNRFQAAPLVTLRDGHSGPIKERRGKVQVEGRIVNNLSTSRLINPGIEDDHRHAQRFLVMGPLACESTVAHVVTVIGGVDDDGIICQSLRFQCLEETRHGMVDSAYHPQVGSHVRTVLGIGVPAPEEAFTVDRGLQEIWLVLKNLGIVQPGRSHLIFFVQTIDCPWPGKMANTRSSVAIFRVTGVKPHVQGKRLVLGLIFKKLNTTIHDQLGLVAQGTIGLFLVERIATNPVKDIKMILRLPALGHLGVPFAGKTSPVTSLAKQVDVELPDRLGAGSIMPARRAITPSGQTGQDRGATDPTDRLADAGIGESRTTGSQSIDGRCFDQGVTVASE